RVGLPHDRAHQALAGLVAWKDALPSHPRCRPGISPHAPYSVHRLLYQYTAGRLPMATHLAESRDELELLAHRRGPFVELLRELGVWAPEGLATGPEDVINLCARAPSRSL